MSRKLYNLIDGDTTVVVSTCKCRTVPTFVDNSSTKHGYTIRCPNCGRTITSYVSAMNVAAMWNNENRGW